LFTIETLLFRCYHNASSTPMVINIIFFLKHCRQHFHVIWSYFPNWRLLCKTCLLFILSMFNSAAPIFDFYLREWPAMYGFWTEITILLRHILGFISDLSDVLYSAYLFRKSANSIFKILNYCPFWRDGFVNLLGMHAPDDQFAVVRLVWVFIINKDWRIMF